MTEFLGKSGLKMAFLFCKINWSNRASFHISSKSPHIEWDTVSVSAYRWQPKQCLPSYIWSDYFTYLHIGNALCVPLIPVNWMNSNQQMFKESDLAHSVPWQQWREATNTEMPLWNWKLKIQGTVVCVITVKTKQ